ncbi:MAG: serine/threonine-protein kinase [Planctomycetales bacterium]
MSEAPQPRPRRAATVNRIDIVCDEFEQRFRSGDPPTIEAFLAEAAAGDRPRLLKELLALELDLRMRIGEHPATADYVARFPAARATIDRLFAELNASANTFRNTAAGQVTAVPATSTPRVPSNAEKPLKGLDDFDLQKELGRGGMGIVYQAYQRSLDRIVALKVIRYGRSVSDADRQRFQTEGKAAAQLDDHPGIIPIHQYGEANGEPYLVMGLVDGPSLAARIRQGPVDEQTAAGLVRKVAEGMAYAHEKGIIHRDLKPDNILLAEGGEPRIADFGLARRLDDSKRLSSNGQVFGTPAYMSPEQAEGRMEAVGPASDIYAVGAILYELLAGRPPFVGDTAVSVLRQVIDDPPPPLREFNPDVAPALEAICRRCLAKSPLKRYATAQKLVEALNNYLGDESKPSSPAALEPDRRGRLPANGRWLAAASLLLAGIILLMARPLWKSRSYEGGAPPVEQAVASTNSNAASRVAADSAFGATASPALVPPTRSQANGLLFALTGHDHHVRAVQFSKDGSRLLSAGEDATWRLWNTRSGESVAIHEDPSGGLLTACFTPEGDRCLTAGFDGIIRLWDVDRGTLVREFRGHQAKVWDAAFVGMGKQFVSASEDGTVRLWEIGSGEELHRFEGHEGAVLDVAAQPDAAIAVSSGADGIIRAWNLQQRTLRQAFPKREGWIWSVSFAPDGRTLFSDDGNRVLEWDPATAGIRRRLTAHHDWIYCVLPSAGGTFLLTGGRDRTIILCDLATGDPLHRYTGHSGDILSLTISPDGRTFASGSQDKTIRIWAIPEAIADRDRSARREK